MRLINLVPDTETLLALAPEELGVYVLQVARDWMQRPPGRSGMCTLGHIVDELPEPLGGGIGYQRARLGEVEGAVTEAWTWLEREGYLVPALGINGTNGWRVLGRRAGTLKDPKAIRAVAKFPKELLHPSIAEVAWMPIMRGELDTAVMLAFRLLEQTVRAASGCADTDVGPPLMRKAFDPEKGPLSDKTRPVGEREGMAHLFAGAFGAFTNPTSHGTVAVKDEAEAQHLVMLASLLLRIVDDRWPRPTP
jgi:uncharacterized protein (TIGR02391 family)